LKDHEKVNEIPSEIVKFKKETVDVAGKATDIYTYELQLGDFKLFGNFLKEISATKKNEHEKSSE
jgi:Zn-dependent M32 family carboxypeptidase